jgi:uncharacterized membrane protein YgdD (TMEM256/DUF423 family)
MCVALGAFGAHGLKNVLSEYQLHIYETGVRYQFYHTFALLAVAILSRYLSLRQMRIAGWLFVAGMVCFSGSLYLLALADTLGIQDYERVLGPVTPIGGLLLIAGWLMLFKAGLGYRHHKEQV